MVTNKLILPNRCRDPYSFEEILINRNNILNTISELDLSQVTFIEPYSMISLLLLGRDYLRARGERLKLVNIPIHIHQYLSRMDFMEQGVFVINKILNKSLLLKRSSFSKRVLEITEIPNKERDSVAIISSVINKFRKRAAFILKYWMSENIIDYFVTVISELCQNIFEHSLDSGFLAMQTYTVENENIVKLTISDSGIGIMKSFEQKEEIKYDSNANLIEMSLTTPISSKRPFGYGLCQVNQIVEKLNGTVYIRSHDASVMGVYNQKSKRSPCHFLRNDLVEFSGTQISISLSS